MLDFDGVNVGDRLRIIGGNYQEEPDNGWHYLSAGTEVEVVGDEGYGYRRVHRMLLRRGIEAGPELVRAVMRELGLVPQPLGDRDVRGAQSVPVQELAQRP